MIEVEEVEKKYCLSNVDRKSEWEKEQIVYQWYISGDNEGHVKEKIIFDLKKARIIYVRITKKCMGEKGSNHKTVEYLDVGDFDVNNYVGTSFVLKRRSINGDIFLDRMIRSNGICDYLLENESDDSSIFEADEYVIEREVTEDNRYYNQNMTVLFTEEDALYLKFLIETFSVSDSSVVDKRR